MKHFIQIRTMKGFVGCPYCHAVVNVKDLIHPRRSCSTGCQVEADCPGSDCGQTSCLTPGLSGQNQANTISSNPDQDKLNKRKNKLKK